MGGRRRRTTTHGAIIRGSLASRRPAFPGHRVAPATGVERPTEVDQPENRIRVRRCSLDSALTKMTYVDAFGRHSFGKTLLLKSREGSAKSLASSVTTDLNWLLVRSLFM